MRRKDREVTDIDQIHKVMNNCSCCRLGFYDGEEVYIVPLNFGYDIVHGNTVLYFHGAKEGRKIDLIGTVQSVGFEMDTDYKLNEGKTACEYSATFQSIIGTGKVSFVENKHEKEKALQAIMYHNTNKNDWIFTDNMVDLVCVFKVVVSKISCKVHE